MHAQKIKLTSAIIAATFIGLVCIPIHGATTHILFEPPTMQEAQQAIQAQDWEKAVEAYRAIVANEPKNPQAQFMLGYALHASGDLDQAILAHKKATKMPAVAPMAYYNLGCAYALKGETTDAYDALEKAIELGTRDPEQFKGDPDLKSLKSDERWGAMIESMSYLTKAENALHFWVGTWDCYSTTDGKLYGKNTLTFRVGKNVIHESWVSTGGQYKGESWNTYNRETNQWEQTWVDTTGNLLHISATLNSDENDGLMYEGKSVTPGKDASLVRMHVRPIEDGRVMQTGFQSDDNGKSWTQSYEFVYVPAGQEFAFEPTADED